MAAKATVRTAAEPVAETPSQALTKQSVDVSRVTDERGRTIGVRKITALKVFRLTKLLGESCSVAGTLSMALTAASVVEIDGDPVPYPQTEMQLEALIDRLDFDGMAAAEKAVAVFSRDPAAEAEDAKN